MLLVRSRGGHDVEGTEVSLGPPRLLKQIKTNV
jgi:hypothetical protein